jgi:LysR family transcriptional regulator, transcriptional activator of nhaA
MKHLKDLNWNHLYYFYEVARLHSLKKVSEFTGLSPSTISEQIKKLEGRLNAQLFQRSRSGFRLTQKGELLFEHAKVIFAEGYRVLERFSTDEVGGYPVEVGVDSAIPSPMSADFIAAYWDLYTPYGVVNTQRQGDHDILIHNIVHETIDWGLSLSPSKRKSLTSQPIGLFQMKLCCARFIFERFKSSSDIPNYLPFIDSSFHHPIKNSIQAHLRSTGLLFNESLHTDNFEYLIRLIRRGRAIALLPETIIDQFDDLIAFQAENKLELPLYAIWKNSNENLISISLLKSLAANNIHNQNANPFLQLEVSEVPKDKLKD